MPTDNIAQPNPDAEGAKCVAAGESGYVNFVLTAFAESSLSELVIGGRNGLPGIVKVAEGDERLMQWASRLTFSSSHFCGKAGRTIDCP